MKAYVSATNKGFVVQALIEDADGLSRYRPVRNFGYRQTDAMEMRDDIIADFYSDNLLKSMAKTYDSDVRYKRIKRGVLKRYEDN